MPIVDQLNERFGEKTPGQLRRKAARVAKKAGNPESMIGSWRRYCWADGAGSVAAWFFGDGERILVLTVDHESDLSQYSDGDADVQSQYFEGLPEDMRELVVGDAVQKPLLPIGEEPVTSATGIFWHDREGWHMTDGLARFIDADEDLELIDTGIGFCLRPFE
ncbi:hypothetical protein VR010_10635 [Actinomycetaceae bacterium L2_0104]